MSKRKVARKLVKGALNAVAEANEKAKAEVAAEAEKEMALDVLAQSQEKMLAAEREHYVAQQPVIKTYKMPCTRKIVSVLAIGALVYITIYGYLNGENVDTLITAFISWIGYYFGKSTALEGTGNTAVANSRYDIS